MPIIIGDRFRGAAGVAGGIGSRKGNGTACCLETCGAGRAVDCSNIRIAARPGGFAHPGGAVLIFAVGKGRRVGAGGIG